MPLEEFVQRCLQEIATRGLQPRGSTATTCRSLRGVTTLAAATADHGSRGPESTAFVPEKPNRFLQKTR